MCLCAHVCVYACLFAHVCVYVCVRAKHMLLCFHAVDRVHLLRSNGLVRPSQWCCKTPRFINHSRDGLTLIYGRL